MRQDNRSFWNLLYSERCRFNLCIIANHRSLNFLCIYLIGCLCLCDCLTQSNHHLLLTLLCLLLRSGFCHDFLCLGSLNELNLLLNWCSCSNYCLNFCLCHDLSILNWLLILWQCSNCLNVSLILGLDKFLCWLLLH